MWSSKCFQYQACWQGNSENIFVHTCWKSLLSLAASGILMAGNSLEIFSTVSCLFADYLILWNLPLFTMEIPFSSHTFFSEAVLFARSLCTLNCSSLTTVQLNVSHQGTLRSADFAQFSSVCVRCTEWAQESRLPPQVDIVLQWSPLSVYSLHVKDMRIPAFTPSCLSKGISSE